MQHWLTAASLLLGKSPSESVSQLQPILLSRLTLCHEHLRLPLLINNESSLPDVQSTTAQTALVILEHIQSILAGQTSSPSNVPELGSRDMGNLRTLVSIVFRWGTQPLLANLSSQWLPSTKSGISDFSGSKLSYEYQLLSSAVTRILNILLSTPKTGLHPTVLTNILVDRHLPDILKPAIALAWLPKSLVTEETRSLTPAKPFVMRLLVILSSAQVISALGRIIAETDCAQHIRRTCSAFLTRQLLRPDGVMGLCIAIFGEDKDAEATLDKLENIAQLLCTPPSGFSPAVYYNTIIPRVLHLLSPEIPEAWRRAASFTTSKILADDQEFPSQKEAVEAVLNQLHNPLLTITPLPDEASHLGVPQPSEALRHLTTLLANVNPSPHLIVSLLSPLVESLYSLLYHLEKIKTSDPELKETLRSILLTWGRITTTTGGADHLWKIVCGEGGHWKTTIAGDILKIEKPERESSLDLLTPESLEQALKNEDMGVNSNLLDLYPDSVHFVRLVAQLGRADIASELFVRLLKTYSEYKTTENEDPTRSLLYVQLIIQMQTQLAEDQKSPTNILDNPSHLVSFIVHVLRTSTGKEKGPEKKYPPSPTGIDRLRFVSIDETLDDGLAEVGNDSMGADDEMVETAVNLLLSIFERNPSLSARSSPELNEAFQLLSPLMKHSNETLRKLAGEARMVMTARLASSSTTQSSKAHNSTEEDPSVVYQKALKLLQDPILPVRAHGLLLLRDLVSSSEGGGKQQVDPALIPAILDIFLQSIHDDDSYIFLNGIQGLSAIVGTYGKDVLSGLLREYAGGLGGLAGTSLRQQDIDVRSRVGEALGQVIKRLGDALSLYIDLLVPPLFNLVRNKYLPPVLRTSSLSLLADCAQTHPIALRDYVMDLSGAMVDLLQTEGVVAVERQRPAQKTQEAEGPKVAEQTPTMDSHPTLVNSKLPPMRRSALHFLSLLVKASVEYSTSRTDLDALFPTWLVYRARTIVGYAAETDVDAVVRVMARETLDLLNAVERARIGL